jgi:2-C-methyl-D-erythritol 2,4-cyclodiphosphate synthase
LRIGIGHDTHRLVEGRPLILAGVTIEYDRGLLGHSDADVVLHAVCDALLGASALGDIGELYPDTDPRWKDVDSSRLLREVTDRVAAAGWRPLNCDVTIHAQRPKLSAYKPVLRANLAVLLGLPVSAVNVKAKTGEHVGPIGRGEAISCDAAVLLTESTYRA